MRLTRRDKLIINTLKNQEFCFYKDIKNKFFPSKNTASNRLKKLKENGFLNIEFIKTSDIGKTFDISCLGLKGRHLKVISLSKSQLQNRQASQWKKRHQILLFSVKERLEKLLGVPAFFDNHIRDLKYTLYDRSSEPLPDLFLKGEDYKLAIELELHVKTKKRYSLKKSAYNRSSFTHVLYVVPHSNKITRLIRNFKYYRFFGLSHYSNLNEVSSFWYGHIPIKKWLNKAIK